MIFYSARTERKRGKADRPPALMRRPRAGVRKADCRERK